MLVVVTEPLTLTAVLLAVALSFGVSASAGLGGSLILVPALSLAVGVKEGVALAALLLAGNNVVKVIAYRRSLPFRAGALVVLLTTLGSLLGAGLLVAAPEGVVTAAVLAMFSLTLVAERLRLDRLQRLGAPLLAWGAGMTSGFSGTSGPLKGVAIRNLRLDRWHMVGAASLASLAGDAAKATVFVEAELLGPEAFQLAAAAVPLMVVATFTGRMINRRISEAGYAMLFWAVMGGYAVRLVAA